MSRFRLLGGAWALIAMLAALALPTAAAAAPTPGAPGIGDRLYPTLGNGGYDVKHYDLAVRYATSAPSQPIDGTATITARATQPLSRFDLDFAGDSVGGVSVNGRRADWTRSGQELVITPRRPLANGRRFVVRVEHFTAHPTEPSFQDFSTVAFFITPDGSATAGQPDSAHFVYPSNDHPRDKASFTFRLDVPAGETAVANGRLIGRRTRGGRTVWSYWQRQPMATELTQIATGRFEQTDRGVHDGVFVRDVTPPSLTASLNPKLASEIDHLRWMSDRVGRYPFDLYGSLVVDTNLGFALETQTLSLYDIPWFPADATKPVWEPTMVHELAHQWFGDSVAPWDWSDVWLNEGHASWYEYLFAEEKGLLPEDTGTDARDVPTLMRLLYASGDQFRADFGPVGAPLGNDVFQVFNPNVYGGGALVLYALRQQVGDATFQQIERTWVRRYRGKSASTADFIALASRVSGQDLTTFLRDWIYGTTTPSMPGHPDWTVDPVTAPAPSGRRAQSAARRQTFSRLVQRRR